MDVASLADLLVRLVVGAGLLWFLWYAIHRRNQRAHKIRALAEAGGWQWVAKDPTLVKAWRGEPFRTFGGASASNVVAGMHRGFAFVTFDYDFASYNPFTWRSYERHQVWVLTLPTSLPRVEVVPAGVVDQVADAVDLGDLKTGDQRFDDAFRVRAEDETVARSILHPALTSCLQDAGNIRWRIDGQSLISWEHATRRWRLGNVPVEEIPKRLDVLCDIAERIPPVIARSSARVRDQFRPSG